MHGHKCVCLKFSKCPNRLFGIHMNLAAGGRIISTDRQQSDVDIVALADFPEAGKESAIAAVKNGAAIHLNGKTSEAPVKIGQKTCSPVIAGGQRNLDRP